MKLTKDLGVLEKINSVKSAGVNKVKGAGKYVYHKVKEPNTLVTSTVMRTTHPQSTFGMRFEKAEDVNVTSELETLNTAITNLEQMKASLQNGLDVDISTIM